MWHSANVWLTFPPRNLPKKFHPYPSTFYLVIVVTNRQTDRQTYAGDYIIPRESFRGDNYCCTAALAVYLLLFSASYYLHILSTTTGARYRRSVCIDNNGHVEACGSGLLQHGLNFSTAWCTMQVISDEKDWKHVLTQKMITLNTCCDVACLTFQLPPITTGSFQSHRRQPTTGSLQSLQCLKQRNEPSVRWRSFAIHKLMWWHFQMGWASGLQFVFFWDNINNQKYVWIIQLEMTCLDFPR